MFTIITYAICTKLEQAPVVQKLDSAIHMINHYPVDEIIRETYCAIRRIEIYLVDSTICLLQDWDHIDNDDQAMVSEIKHSVSNPLRELNNYDKAMYIIYSLFLEL